MCPTSINISIAAQSGMGLLEIRRRMCYQQNVCCCKFGLHRVLTFYMAGTTPIHPGWRTGHWIDRQIPEITRVFQNYKLESILYF